MKMDNTFIGPEGMFTNAVGRGKYDDLRPEAIICSVGVILGAIVALGSIALNVLTLVG